MKLKRREPKPAEHIEKFFRELRIPQAEWEDESLDLHRTPARIAKMFHEELLAGYRTGALEELKRRFTTFPAEGKDSLVTIADIGYVSSCAHHGLPFAGTACVGYLPADRIIGASKIPRVIEHYSRMFQNQERLTRQVVDFIAENSGARFVIGIFQASHECMRCRGVKQQNAKMVTTSVHGVETENGTSLIAEFYQQLNYVKGTR